MEIRAGVASDEAFLFDMLVEAYNWDRQIRITREQIASDPHLNRYLAGWPRPDDFAVVAVEVAHGRVGAAWVRLFAADDPGYGFVADDIPEVSIAVLNSRRGHGIGRALMLALLDEARSRRLRALSLSVEDGNRAKRLYQDLGFVVTGRSGDSDVMTCELADSGVSAAPISPPHGTMDK